MFQAQYRETINSTWKVAVRVLQDHYDDERDKIVFHKTIPNLQDQDQDQDHSVQDQDQDRFFWSDTGLVQRPTVSDHITGKGSLSSRVRQLSENTQASGPQTGRSKGWLGGALRSPSVVSFLVSIVVRGCSCK